MAKITYPDKSEGDQFFGTEATEIKGVVNANVDLTEPNTWYVNTNGSDSNVGSPEFPFETIQAAHDAAVAGDTIIIQNTDFDQPSTPAMSITKDLTIRGTSSITDKQAKLRGTWNISASVNLEIDMVQTEGVTFAGGSLYLVKLSNGYHNNVTSTTRNLQLRAVASEVYFNDPIELYSLKLDDSYADGDANIGATISLIGGSFFNGDVEFGMNGSSFAILNNSTFDGDIIGTGSLRKKNSVITGTETITGTTTSRQAKVFDDNVQFKGQASAIGGFGKLVAFSEAITANSQGYFPDYTQTGVLNFTKDGTVVDNEGLGNGRKGIIVYSGDAWNFTPTSDFNKRIDTLQSGKKYFFESIWNGLKFDVNVLRIDDSLNVDDFAYQFIRIDNAATAAGNPVVLGDILDETANGNDGTLTAPASAPNIADRVYSTITYKTILCEGIKAINVGAINAVANADFELVIGVEIPSLPLAATDNNWGAKGAAADDLCQFFISATGEVNYIIGNATDGRGNQAQTVNPMSTGYHWIRVKNSYTSNQASIYLDGILQTLDGTFDGDLSALTPGNFALAIDTLLGARNNNGVLDGGSDNKYIVKWALFDKLLSDAEIESVNIEFSL